MAQSHRPALQTISLREDIVLSERIQLDKDKNILRGVKILGLKSANGRNYTPAAIRAAAGMYEGIFVNKNHPRKQGEARDAEDRLGWLEGVRVEADGLYGDLHYLNTHPFTPRLIEAAERRPQAFGLSHNAHGQVRGRDGKGQVESITSVRSVDLVADPASTHGLFEQDGYDMNPEMGMADGGSPEDKLSAGFEAAIMAVVGDKSMDVAGKVSKIRELLKMHEKALGGGGSEGSSGGGDSEESPAAEGKQEPKAEPTLAQLQEQVATTQRQIVVRALCDAAGFLPNALQLKTLVALTEETDQKALVEHFVAAKAAASNGHVKARSVSARQLTEAKDADNKMPADSADFAKRLVARRR